MAAAPSRLGPYEILAPLGAGGMGQVYRARDPRFRRDVAIKVLPDDFASDPERLKRFEHEARAAGALNHPNILTVHDLGTDHGAPYLVTELLEGETLRERLARPIPVARALDWATQIAQGLAAAHEQGIVHRDLKPENLFLTKDGRAKILDFGLARLGVGQAASVGTTLTLTEAGVTLGTVGYMAPEQVRGEPADHRSDLFSFGCVLYELLGGTRAFPGEVAVQVMGAILSAEPRPLAELRPEAPAALERLVRHCLEKDPAQRFQSTRDLIFALEAIASGATPGAAPIPRRSSGVRAGLVTALGLAGIGCGVIGFTVARNTAAPPQPTYRRLTFLRGTVESARFAPDGQTIVYSAAWDGGAERIYTTRTESPATSPLSLPEARLLDVSSRGELAIALAPRNTLARVPLAGGAPREMMDSVTFADWSPDGTELSVVREILAAGHPGGPAGVQNRLEFPAGRPLWNSGARLRCPRVSPRGDHVAFFESPNPLDSRGTVAIVDRQGTLVARSRVWSDGWGLDWSPGGDAVWFTAADSSGPRSLHELARNGRERTLLRVPGALTLFDVFRDGHVLLARVNHGFSSIGLPPWGTRERDLSWMEWSVAAGLSADGRQVLLGEFGEAVGSRYAVALRGTDGSPVVRLGEGYAGGLSSDGAWAVAVDPLPRPHIVVLPTGPGAVRSLDPHKVTQISWSSWIAGMRSVLFEGWEGDRGPYCYWQDIEGGAPHPFTPDSVVIFWLPSSPDGRYMIGRSSTGRALLWPIHGGDPRPVLGLRPDETPVGWCADGRSVFVRSGALPARIERLDFETGRREFVRDLMPSDLAGVTMITNTLLTPDGRSYAYVVQRVLSDLYLVEGLR